MKTIKFLKMLITIYYYLLILALTAGFITIPILLFTSQTYKINLFGQQYDLGSLGIAKSIIITVILGAVLYFYFKAIRLMRMTVTNLQNGQYFTETIIVNFKKVGDSLLICGVGFVIVSITLQLFLKSKLYLGLDSSLFLFVITGLFFLCLSEVFKEARAAKEENDLTI